MRRNSVLLTLAIGMLGSTALGLSRVQDRVPPDAAPAKSQPDTVPATRPEVVRGVKLDMEFPAVGNVEAVKQWRFGRVERVDDIANSRDIIILVRLGDGSTVKIIGPAAPLDALARQSNWLSSPGKSTPGRADYIERMVAFDVDDQGRLIAAASLEPTSRNSNRLRDALVR